MSGSILDRQEPAKQDSVAKARIACECMALAVITQSGKADVFVEYAAHVDSISVSGYAGKWEDRKEQGFKTYLGRMDDWAPLPGQLRRWLESLEPCKSAVAIAKDAVKSVEVPDAE